MRLSNLLTVTALCWLLSGCVAPMLAMGQNQLMWSLIKPLVGLDPSSSKLFEQPMIKNRMTALLGDDYQDTLALLRTAPKLQQEGTLFYLASNDTLTQGSDRASLVWNAQTNQMSALLNKGDLTQVFTESDSEQTVAWPQTVQTWLAEPDSAGAKAAAADVETERRQLKQELTAAQQKLKAAQAQLQALQTDSAANAKVEEKLKATAQSKLAAETKPANTAPLESLN
ncbi:hypothetical protein GCM10011502_04170 [Oceanisphaera marina]|uniref:Lipoprotein n=1 Tax=Oceanisphaera marina TaxID=2017550 RepID=A0ABQ1ICQ7_9GAMM|nr:hypothetical protein [Oceanisphaera marina]GGB34291.1 hypothetical protein GCM10011502_04170 [Oceanisphaera marina]